MVAHLRRTNSSQRKFSSHIPWSSHPVRVMRRSGGDVCIPSEKPEQTCSPMVSMLTSTPQSEHLIVGIFTGSAVLIVQCRVDRSIHQIFRSLIRESPRSVWVRYLVRACAHNSASVVAIPSAMSSTTQVIQQPCPPVSA